MAGKRTVVPYERMKSRQLAVTFGLALLITTVLFATGANVSKAQDSAQGGLAVAPTTTQFAGTIRVAVGQTALLNVNGLDRFQTGAPNIATAQKSQDGTQLLITGKKAGTTVLNVWEKGQMKSYQVQVMADMDGAGQTSGMQSLTMKPGASQIIHGKGIRRTATSDPNAVDIVPVSTTEVILNAKAPGSSVVRIWDDYGLTTYNVVVEEQTVAKKDLNEQITREIGIPTVRAQVVDDKGKLIITLHGEVPNMELAHKAERIASAYGSVQNLIKVESEAPSRLVDSIRAAINNPRLTYRVLPDETILIEGSVPTQEEALKIKWVVQTWLGTTMQEERAGQPVPFIGGVGDNAAAVPDVTNRTRLEVGTVESTTGGADIVSTDQRNVIRHVWGGRLPEGPRLAAIIEVNPALAQQILVRAQIVEINRSKLKELGVEWGEINASVDSNGNITFNFERQPFIIGEDPSGGTINPIDDVGPLRRLRSLGAQIRALVEENNARVLSEPKVLIVDGSIANIHVGGQIPVPVAQTSAIGTSGAITVTWKDFGILLTVKPEITDDNRVYMTVSPEASTLDFANAVEINNFVIPAIRLRRATTAVHVNDGESLVIGGLISSEDAKLVRRIPLLSKIPIIGELFKSTDFVRRESELIILVTPQIVGRSATAAAGTSTAPVALAPSAP